MAQEEPGLLHWEKAREYRRRAAEARTLLHEAPTDGVRTRAQRIEQYYLELAEEEESLARALYAATKRNP